MAALESGLRPFEDVLRRDCIATLSYLFLFEDVFGLLLQVAQSVARSREALLDVEERRLALRAAAPCTLAAHLRQDVTRQGRLAVPALHGCHWPTW